MKACSVFVVCRSSRYCGWLSKAPLAERIAVTLPTPDAQSSRSQAHAPYMPFPSHSISLVTPMPPVSSSSPSSLFPPDAATRIPQHEHAFDFATHSLDLATGGLKTLTAKRELPTRPDRRTHDTTADFASARSFTFVLVILMCAILMLIGGCIVLFVMLQP